MKILHEIWRYWKSLSVWFCTAFVVLFILAAIVDHFKTPPAAPDDPAARCLDDGGTWDAEKVHCRFSA